MQRFWNKVEKTDGCWLWTAYKLRDGYGQFGYEGKVHLAHRVSWHLEHGAWPDQHLDHVCGNRACVNPAHLRDCSHKENTRYQKPREGGASKYKGVHWDKSRGKWQAQITVGCKKRHLGYFVSEEEAARAYDAAAARLHGEFALTNENLGLLGD